MRPCNDVLMVGFHFPPCALSSGHLRLLAFCRYLPEFGWNPIVLSATDCAYEKVDPSSVSAIPDGIHVHRAFGLDTKHHLGIRGHYLSTLARPDRWVSWWPAAVLTGLRLVRKYHVRAIWSTYPIMTAHCVAHTLSRMAGIPWIADFRDPVAVSVTGKDPMTVRSQTRWEQRVLSRAAYSVFTTPSAMRICTERYPFLSGEGRVAFIPNGFDEDDFAQLPVPVRSGKRAPLHLVHAGVLYPDGRNPSSLFDAIASLKEAGALSSRDLRVTLRASGSEGRYKTALQRLGISDVVELAPYLPYKEALAEQARADGLLLFQGPEFDQQIPAKLYEYMRIGRPIFAMVGAHGDTAELLRGLCSSVMAPIDDARLIKERLVQFIGNLREAGCTRTSIADVSRYSRRNATGTLATLLNDISASQTAKRIA